MPIYSTLIDESIYFSSPPDLYAIAGWGILLICILYFLRQNWEPVSISFHRDWFLYVILALVTPLAVFAGGLRIDNIPTLPLPNLPGEAQAPILFLLLAVPWQLAAGLLGVGPAFILGVISGVCLGALNTHNYFTILEIGGMALVFAFLVRQNYRSWLYLLARIPLVAALITALIFFPIQIINRILSVSGSLASRIDYGLNQTIDFTLLRSGEILIAGAVVSILYAAKSDLWKFPKILQPSPYEQKFENRFLLSVFPVITVIILVLFISDWQVAGGAAKRMVEERLRNTAEMAAGSIPYFLEAGQSQALSLADTGLTDGNQNLTLALTQKLRNMPFFKLLFVFDATGQPLGGYPYNQFDQIPSTSEELAGIELALQGVAVQTYVVNPWTNDTSAQISFIVSIKDENGQPQGVLLARTDLSTNPFTQPALEALRNAAVDGGEGMILDGQNRVLYHTTAMSEDVLALYQGVIPDTSGVFETYSPQAQRQLGYYQPVVGSAWKVMVSTPVQQYQDQVLRIAGPLMIVLIAVYVIVFILFRLSLRPISNTLKTLTAQASLISQGNLDQAVQVTSEDEFGQLADSFEQMRLKLKNRLEELNHLLLTSQSVGEHLEINEAFERLLQTVLSSGGEYARVVLPKEVVPEHLDKPYLSIGVGGSNDAIQSLDRQLFENLHNHDKLVITNLSRMRRFVTPPGSKAPGAILAVSLHHENQYYGVLWIGYQESRLISEEEIRFVTTLASQAAMAAANAKLYATAELGRQRLEAVINSTPEPVMVFDDNDHLLLMNPAAMQLRGLINSSAPGQPLQDVISNEILLDLLKNYNTDRNASHELQLSNDRTYYTSVTSVTNNHKMVGKVCLLRDITHFRQLDTLKSDVVSTVSHDLRSPLTFMRGYATMIQMVGELNEQQRGYVGKIVSGIDNMTKLVNNLLDLGRIESGIGQTIEKVSPQRIVGQVLSELQPIATQKNINLIFKEGNADNLLVDADPALLQQAVFNLVENAIKFTNMDGKVEIGVSEREGNVVFEIQDTGIGIAPIDQPHLFDKFYRSNRRESYKNRGTGLGLAIVKTIVERHYGKVWMESKLGRGSSFYLEIPVRHEEEKSL